MATCVSSKVRLFNHFDAPFTDLPFSLVSLSTPPSSKVGTTEVKVFRHEFITIFRLSHSMSLSSSDLRILEPIDDEVLKYEEEKETVFLAKELVEQLRRMTDPRFQQPRMRYTSHPSHRRR